MICSAKTRPFVGDTECSCELDDDHHVQHIGVIRDYAYEGSSTRLVWFEDDRRNFHGVWPGNCSDTCSLPSGHRGNHI